MVKATVEAAGIQPGDWLDQPFDHMIRELAETDV
jgi:phycobilisome core component